MVQTKQRIIFLALGAFLALFLGCKGESPTAPPAITTSGTGTGSGTGQPPVGASIALSASTLTPTTSSISTITATVTQNNVTVPNGTAVEFATTSPNANFTDTSDAPTTLIRTTTAGIAKATVTASTAGPVVVNVTVNNVTKSITLTFQDVVIPPPPGSTTPTISAVTPSTGLPTGNQSVVITGTNFRSPVRVLFTPDPASGLPAKEAFATLVTPTQINVISPGFDLGVSQQLIVSITVIVEAGAPTEQRVTKASAFTYTAPVLTPVVRSLSPTSGPIDGGTRVTVTGDAFEAPLQIFFGAAQAQVVGSIQFHTFDVLTPAARDTNADGSGPKTGPVDVKVVDVNSGKSVVVPSAFRYVNKAQITAITPDQGPFTGGTRVVIDGTGFDDPVTVYLDGIAASVTKVTGTQVLATSNGIAIAGCADSTGPVVVTNVDNGDTATAPVQWIYRVLKPVIVSVASPPGGVIVGTTTTVRVANAIGLPRITVGTTSVSVIGQTDNGDGTTTFTIQVPASLTLSTQACAAGGNQQLPTPFDVSYTSLTTTCTDTLKNGLTIAPLNTPTLTLVPPSFQFFAGNITPGSVGPPVVAPTVTQPPPQTVTIVDTGAAPLNITSVTQSGAGCGSGAGQINVTLPPPQTLSTCDSASIVAKYNATTAPSSAQCSVTINTNAGSKTLQLSAASQ